jgi:hypothetical protein
MIMKEELENCPFCGDGADLIKSKLTNGYAVGRIRELSVLWGRS